MGPETSQLLEDLEASITAFPGTGRFTSTATAASIKVAAAGVVQPGVVRAIRVLKADHITILHRGTIHCVSGKDLESGVIVAQPVVSAHVAYDSLKTTIKL